MVLDLLSSYILDKAHLVLYDKLNTIEKVLEKTCIALQCDICILGQYQPSLTFYLGQCQQPSLNFHLGQCQHSLAYNLGQCQHLLTTHVG